MRINVSQWGQSKPRREEGHCLTYEEIHEPGFRYYRNRVGSREWDLPSLQEQWNDVVLYD